MRTSFLTGSRVYGKPHNESDIDLVIRCSRVEAEKLKEMADVFCTGGEEENYAGVVHDSGLVILRFGSLNLICCTTNAQLVAWKMATDRAVDKSVTEGKLDKEKAIELFKRTFSQVL